MSGTTVSVDLAQDLDAVRHGYGRDLARQIRRGRSAGLVTVEDMDWACLQAFGEQYRETMDRLGAGGFYYFSVADFERLHRCLETAAHLLITRLGDEIAAAGLFLESGDNLEWHLVSTNTSLSDLSPSKVLVDDALVWAKARGFTTAHLGGGRGGREDSLFWFKSRFSPRRHRFAVGGWVIDGAQYGRLLEMRGAGPRPHPTADPTFFPAYRAPSGIVGADAADATLVGP